MSFAASIKAFEDKALRKANDNTNKAIVSLGLFAIQASPTQPTAQYSKGHLVNQWRLSVGAPDVSDDGSTSLGGIASLSRIKSFIGSTHFLGKDNVVFLTNSATYSYRANFLGWKPKGKGTNGWTWTGTVGGYGFIGIAINNLKGTYM